MPYVKKYRISEEGNHYPESDEFFVNEKLIDDLNRGCSEDEYYQVYEMPYRQRVLMGSSEIVDFNRNF